MEKYELEEELKPIYKSTKKEPRLVNVPTMSFLCFEGSGHPEEADFKIACETLYTLAYLIKFEIARKKLDIDFKVSPMEVKWHIDKVKDQKKFTWIMMIRQPEFVTTEMVNEAISLAKTKGKAIAFERVAFKKVDGGLCIQAFHLGDYQLMNDTLEKMIALAKENGLSYEQYTHDIYLNDSRKTKTENLKTIMRIKVKK